MIKLGDLKRMEISIGEGIDSFPMKRGSFQYKEKMKWKKKGKLVCEEESAEALTLAMLDEKGICQARITAISEQSVIRIHTQIEKEGVNRLELALPIDEDEHFYGCGETFAAFDLRGERVRIWVAEHQNTKRISKKIIAEKIRGKRPWKMQSLDAYESYYVQPTFVSSKKYFVHVETDSYMEFDFTQKNKVLLKLRKNDDIVIGCAKDFETLSEILAKQLGKARVLPDWIYDGVILGIQGGTETVAKKLKAAQKAGVPVTGVWCQDWSGCRQTGFGYQVMWNWQQDEELYPNLKATIAEWKEKGVHFLGYINPFLAIEKELYHYASKKGYCVKNQKGEDYLVTITTFPAAMVDFTNPKAYEWYKNVIKEEMIGLGLAGWMADFGEYLPPDAVLASGENAKEVHNTWPAIWAKMNREAIYECKKETEIFFFTRAGYTDSIANSDMMWNGDQHVDWSGDDGLPSVIPATLSLSMSGVGVTHSDAGGYTTIFHMTRSKELLMRWEEMNAFSPLLRTHEGNQPARNIQFDADDELLMHLAKMGRIHAALKDYLKELEKEASERGIPVMRPLFYHYEEAEAYTESYEYLLGRDILVAPVLKEGERTRKCYLPKDCWVHLFTGETFAGGTIEIAADIGTPPVFIREQSKIKETLIADVQKITK